MPSSTSPTPATLAPPARPFVSTALHDMADDLAWLQVTTDEVDFIKFAQDAGPRGPMPWPRQVGLTLAALRRLEADGGPPAVQHGDVLHLHRNGLWMTAWTR